MTTPQQESIPDSRTLRRRAAKKKYRESHPDRIRAYQKRTKDAARVRSERFWENNPEKRKTYWKEYAQRNRERIQDRQRRKNYGVSTAEWDALFIAQGSCCAICGSLEPGGKLGWSGDHNHATNQFRGILCRVCNVMLGHAKDDIGILQRAIEYLRDPPYKPYH